MNKYYAAFPFKGEYQYVMFDANQLANEVMSDTDDILEFKCDTEGQYFMKQIYHENQRYDVVFGSEPHFMSVYYPEDFKDESLAGYVVEKDIPWILLKIERDGNVLYNIADNI